MIKRIMLILMVCLCSQGPWVAAEDKAESKILDTNSNLSVEESGKGTDKNDEFKYGKPIYGLALGMKIKIKRFNFDGDLDHIVLVIVRIKNVSDKKIRIVHLPPKKSICPFSVIDASNKKIPKTRYQKGLDNLPPMHSMGIHGSGVYPGEFSESTFILSKRFDFSLLGTYTVQYTRKINIEYSGKSFSFDISSPKITFSTIQPKSYGETKRQQER